jgi:virulence factor Mce-like protein
VNLRIPKIGATVQVVCVALAVVLFIYLMGRFGGRALHFSSVYRVTATVPDTKQLAVRSDVDVRGVKVGQVESISLRSSTAEVTFSVQSRYAPLYRDATVQIGETTLLGESYVDLNPGHPAAGALHSGTILPARSTLPASIEIDQALNALSPAARGHMISTLETFATGAGAADAPAQVGATLAELSAATSQLRALTGTLRGQEGDIANGVEAAQVVLGQLGEHEAAVQEIVSGGRATLGALASRDAALQAGVAELPRLPATGQRTLRDVRPLLGDAGPLVSDLRAAAGPLGAALTALPPVTSAANTVVSGLGSFNRVTVPVLSLADDALSLANPVSVTLPPALRNLVTIVQFLSARKNTVAAWFANTADLGSHCDSKGYFARFFINFDISALAFPDTFVQNNAYTPPNDAAHNQPYSGYPHLLAYTPPPPKRP